MRSPGRSPAAFAGPSSSTRPMSAGRSPAPKGRKPSPSNSMPGSVSRRASTPTSIVTSRCQPSSASSVSGTRPSDTIWSSISTSADSQSAVPTSPTATIRSPCSRPAWAAYESGSTSPTAGTSVGMPYRNSAQYAMIANRKLNAGPASSTAMRCGTGRWLNARPSSASGMGPSRVSRNRT